MTATTPVYEYDKKKQYSVLSMNTLAFTVNFAVWTMFSVIGIKIKGELGLSETEFGLLIATPILTGSLVRLPLGFLTDRFGGRRVYFIQMILVAIATYGLHFADKLWQYLTIGLCMGLAGGSFAIGIAYTSAWFEKKATGFCDGYFWRRQRGRGTEHLCRSIDYRGHGLARSTRHLLCCHAGDGLRFPSIHLSGSPV